MRVHRNPWWLVWANDCNEAGPTMTASLGVQTHPATAAMPRTIYTLWLQGEALAPPIVRLNLRRWAALNPNYVLRVLDRHDVAGWLADSGIPLDTMPIQALSDMMRARVLLLEGGIWTDASVFPSRPLDDWLPAALNQAGFFAFDRPDADRAVASWFLAASPGHRMMQQWWTEVRRFWSKPRTLARYPNGIIPADPVWTVAPDGGAATDEFPYFWFHYLFGYLPETDPAFAAQWALCPKVPAGPPPAHRSIS
jgi:hypothetical protein